MEGRTLGFVDGEDRSGVRTEVEDGPKSLFSIQWMLVSGSAPEKGRWEALVFE